MTLLKGWRARARTAAAAMAMGAIVAGSLGAPATALPTDQSEAEGRLLSGGGIINLNGIAALDPAYSADPSATGEVTHPLSADVLSALNIDLGDGIQLFGENPVLAVGALDQYANTSPTEVPLASSGLIGSDGAIAVAPAGENGDAYVNLTPLLEEAGLLDLISELELNLGAVSASATLDADGNPVGDYQVANGKLILKSPAVDGLAGELETTSAELSTTLNGIAGEDGAIDTALNPVLSTLQETLNTALLGLGTVDDLAVTATMDVDLQAALDSVLAQEITSEDSAVSINFSDGTIEIDIAKLIADSQGGTYDGTLNGLDPNTEILEPALIQAALDGAIGSIADQVTDLLVTAVTDAVNSTDVQIDITGDVALGPVPVGNIHINVDGTLGGLIGADGSDPAEVNFDGTSVVGLDIGTILTPILSDITETILPELVQPISDAITDAGALDTVFRPVVEAAVTVLSPLFTQISDNLLSVVVNVQEEPGEFTTEGADSTGSFTQRAVKLTLLPALVPPAAEISLASATVRGIAAEDDSNANASSSAAASATADDDSNASADVAAQAAANADADDNTAASAAADADATAAAQAAANADASSDASTDATSEANAAAAAAATAAADADANDATNADASAAAAQDANADSDSSAASAAEAASTADSSSDASVEASATSDADASADPGADATDDADPNADATDDADPNADATDDADPNADATDDADPSADATDDADPNADATDDADPNTDATDDDAADPNAAAIADADADVNANAASAAAASANADDDSNAASEAAAQAAANADATAAASAAADADATAAAQAAATADASSDASTDATSEANASSAAAAQAAADADANDATNADASAAAESNAAAASEAASTADSSNDASANAAASADASSTDDADATADPNANAASAAAASANADDDSNAASEAAAQAAANADATDAASAAADADATAAAQAAANDDASSDASTDATSEANAASAAAAQAAANADATDASNADASAAADANAAAASEAASNADSSANASAAAAANAAASSDAAADGQGELRATIKFERIIRGTGVVQEVYGTGFAAGESVTATVKSDPFDLTAVANQDGNVTFTFPVGNDFDLGDHVVLLVGADSGAVPDANSQTNFVVVSADAGSNTAGSAEAASSANAASSADAASSANANAGADSGDSSGSNGGGGDLADTGASFGLGLPIGAALLILLGGSALTIARIRKKSSV